MNEIEKELETTKEQLAQALMALEPFAHDDLCELLSGNFLGDASIVFVRNDAELRIGDFKRARSVLQKIGRGK